MQTITRESRTARTSEETEEKKKDIAAAMPTRMKAAKEAQNESAPQEFPVKKLFCSAE